MKDDPKLWSGCISGAVQEHEFLQSFLAAGFVAVGFDKWEVQLWQVVEDIEFRSVTVIAVKPNDEPCLDKGHAVLYRGPFAKAYDDEDHVFLRGRRMAVCKRSYNLLTGAAYADQFIDIAPVQEKTPQSWCHKPGALGTVSETKSSAHKAESGSC